MGHFTMALPGIFSSGDYASKTALSTLDTTSFFLGLILIVFGTGLLKPNISSIVGQLYPEGSSKRDAGFSIFYMGINLGALIAPIACSTLAEYDWHLGFGLAGFGMVLGLIQYKLTGSSLEGYGDAPIVSDDFEQAKQNKLKSAVTWIGIVLVGLIGIMFTGIVPIDVVAIAGASGTIIALVAFAYLGYVILFGGLDKSDRNKVGVIAILFLFSAMFLVRLRTGWVYLESFSQSDLQIVRFLVLRFQQAISNRSIPCSSSFSRRSLVVYGYGWEEEILSLVLQ